MPVQPSRARSRSVRSGALPTAVTHGTQLVYVREALRDVQVFKAQLQRAIRELQALEIELLETEQRLVARARGR